LSKPELLANKALENRPRFLSVNPFVGSETVYFMVLYILMVPTTNGRKQKGKRQKYCLSHKHWHQTGLEHTKLN